MGRFAGSRCWYRQHMKPQQTTHCTTPIALRPSGAVTQWRTMTSDQLHATCYNRQQLKRQVLPINFESVQ